MNNDKQTKQSWWAPAIMIFFNVSVWIACPVVISLILGKYLDTIYDTKPWFFLGLTGIAFLISIFGIVKILKKYLEEIEKEDKKTE